MQNRTQLRRSCFTATLLHRDTTGNKAQHSDKQKAVLLFANLWDFEKVQPLNGLCFNQNKEQNAVAHRPVKMIAGWRALRQQLFQNPIVYLHNIRCKPKASR
jgi:hypothetical protein